MTPNVDPETGIHYGIHSANNLDQEVLNNFNRYEYSGCPYCGFELDMAAEKCQCGEYIEDMELAVVGGIYEKDGYIIQHDYDSNWAWVFKSPYTTQCRPCSPCAPNAGDLDTPCDSGVQTYCLDASFFPDEKAPYEYKKR